MKEQTITETNFPNLKLFKRGKVRDVYEAGEYLLIVATDRLSAFDVVMPQGIPWKGKVLTQISKFWFDFTSDIVPNPLISTKVDEFPPECREYADVLRGRTMLVKKTEPLGVECIVRGYLSGSGWSEYQKNQTVCKIPLPSGLTESARLPEAIFTPSTKADLGAHDENISFEEMIKIEGRETSAHVKAMTVKIYAKAAAYAESRGIIIADTKMEFGKEKSSLLLIDELLTPDSSRFWPRDKYQPGKGQDSFDKQFVRDYLISINFNKRPPGPQMPEDVIQKTAGLYREALRRLTGKDLEE
jgi:phosphoribosylaminoimidazole-succinocarboxamide synthase